MSNIDNLPNVLNQNNNNQPNMVNAFDQFEPMAANGALGGSFGSNFLTYINLYFFIYYKSINFIYIPLKNAFFNWNNNRFNKSKYYIIYYKYFECYI